jgi:hypothetical protein
MRNPVLVRAQADLPWLGSQPALRDGFPASTARRWFFQQRGAGLLNVVLLGVAT